MAGRAFLGFVSRARMNRNKLDGAKELKKMVFFSNIVVAPLLEDMKVRSELTECYSGCSREIYGP